MLVLKPGQLHNTWIFAVSKPWRRGKHGEMIETLKCSHINAVTQLHIRSLTGLLHDLGPGATRAFYHGAVGSSSAVGYVDVQEGGLSGFILGSASPQRLRREILANSFFRTLLGTCSGVIRKPKTLRSLLSSFLPGNQDYDSQAAELIYLAVDQGERSAGVGKQLVEYFSQKLSESGVTAYELSVDADNQNAIRFYDRLGFVEINRYQEFGIDHKRYRMELA
jgi:ribosomal protein S18 acetylase RimI-like enzyme